MLARAFSFLALILLVVVSAATATEDELKEQTYKGEAKVEDEGVVFKGTMRLKLVNLTKDGIIKKAEVRFSNGLVGIGELSGTIDKQGKLRLAGTLIDSAFNRQWEFTLRARVEHDTISGHYAALGQHGAGDYDGEFRLELQD